MIDIDHGALLNVCAACPPRCSTERSGLTNPKTRTSVNIDRLSGPNHQPDLIQKAGRSLLSISLKARHKSVATSLGYIDTAPGQAAQVIAAAL